MPPMIFEIIFGSVLALAGSELLVRGSASFASKRGASDSIIGLLIVGAGLSAPILYTTLQAATTGSPNLAVGIIYGGFALKLLCILGVCAYIASLPTDTARTRQDTLWIIIAALLFVGLSVSGEILTQTEALLLLAGLVYWMLHIYKTPENRPNLVLMTRVTDCSLCSIAYMLVGLGLVITGADTLIDGSVWLARTRGLQESAVGAIITAAGASLPVLIACIASVYKKRPETVFFIISGSAIFGLLGSAGIAAYFTPISFPANSYMDDLILLTLLAFALPLSLRVRKQFATVEGMVLVALFIAYGVYSLRS